MKKISKIKLNTAVVICFVIVLAFVTYAADYTFPTQDKKKIQEIFGNPLLLSSYGHLPGIEPVGYFNIGRRYVHAPYVEFKPVDKADYYDIFLLQYDQILGVTRTKNCSQYADNGWDEIEPGKAGIVIIAYNKDGKKIALSRVYPFYVVPDFLEKASAAKKYSYMDAAIKAFRSLQKLSNHSYFESLSPAIKEKIKYPVVLTACLTAKNEPTEISYPNLHDWIYVEMIESMSKFAGDALKKELRDFADSVGEHLLMCRKQDKSFKYKSLISLCVDFNCKPNSSIAFEHFDPEKVKRIVEPGKCAYSGKALLKLYKITEDERYLNAAIDMAETFCDTQQENGSWYARVDAKTGEPIGGTYSTSVVAVVSFLDMLNQIKPHSNWISTRNKAIYWLEKNPFKTHGWVLNFDDGLSMATEKDPYKGLSNWDLFEAVRFLAKKQQLFSDATFIVKDNLRWNDNHFVFYGDDPFFWSRPYYPTCGEQGNASTAFYNGCWNPMDFHTANWGTALLAAYSLTKDEIYFKKACYAANALTQYQVEDGRTITWMADRTFGLSVNFYHGNRQQGQGFYTWWPAGSAASAWFWSKLVNINVDE
jgi:hypothetical protein